MAATDQIELAGLRVMASVGVLPEERSRRQPLELDLVLTADLAPAGASDALADTVDYGAVADAVVAACAQRHYDLLAVSYTHLRAHETVLDLVCRLLVEQKKRHSTHPYHYYS
mgnify:CR=1 FL=1